MVAEPRKQCRDRQGASGRQEAFSPGGVRPLGYLLTFTCYGTWLHGDERGSVDRYNNSFEADRVSPSISREEYVQHFRMGHSPFKLDAEERAIVHHSISETCDRPWWTLHSLNVRTNHVHAVVTGDELPNPMGTAFKAWATRRLKEAALIERGTKVWTRGGSTPYLWTEENVAAAILYVSEGQGPSLVSPEDLRRLTAGRSLPVAAPFERPRPSLGS